ncbi:hypothetical protein F4808DRAFT_452851 [Astrocystis sublimbata]|nr:hypothetical protein F4808DRAFT_452851 [Astrocystis sublimbata]
MDQWNLDIASTLYKPLEGDLPIRLLIVHPGRGDEPLKTELNPTTLDECQESYDATSYTWGSSENPELINCGDLQIWIQRNAFLMLLDLRRPDKPRTVWIDAICMNQCDIEERAAQVAIMHHIYRRARLTLVWLGPPDEHASAAMEFAATLDAKTYVEEFSKCRYGNDWDMFAEKSYFFDPSFRPGEEDVGESQELAIAIVEFLNRPWFSRVWIQQEASLSPHVQVNCGPNTVEWDTLFALAWIMCPRYTETWPDHVQKYLSRTLYNTQAVRLIQQARHCHLADVYGQSDYSLSIEGFVETVHRYGATNPRDRMYAMGNMVDDSHKWFEIDYKIPWESLYADVARRFIDVDAFRFLGSAGRARQKAGTALPSWAPDFRYKEESECFMITKTKLWKAGGSIQAALNPPTKWAGSKVSPLPKNRRRPLPKSDDSKDIKGKDKLLLQSYATFKCLMSDEIIYVGDFIDNEKDDLRANTLGIVASIRKDIDRIGTLGLPTYLNGDTLLDAYKLTLIMSCDAQQEIVRSDYVDMHWDKWFSWYEQGCPGYWADTPKLPEMNPSFDSSGATKSFRFALTQNGYFCLVPNMVQIGDAIAIFQNYNLAVVLRPLPPLPPPKSGQAPSKDDQEPYFELVGDSYVHGMMENEARCISDEFECKYQPTPAQLSRVLEMSGQGESWATLNLHPNYERILETLGLRTIRLV